MTLTKNPIVPLKDLKERAMGFLLNFWKRILQKDSVDISKELNNALAVDLGHSRLVILEVEKKQDHLEITNLKIEPRPHSPEAISEQLKMCLKGSTQRNKKIRIAVKGQGVVIRILAFPQMSRRDFKDALRYEIEKYIPFKASEIVFDFQIMAEHIRRGNSEVMEVLLVAVRQTEIFEILRIFQGAGLEVELIDISAFAFANFVEWASPDVKKIPFGFLDIGYETSTFGISIRGRPTFIRDISFGGADIQKILKRKLGLEVDQIHSLLDNPNTLSLEVAKAIEQGIESLLMELKLSLGYYQDRVQGAEPIEALFLGGGGSRFIIDTDAFGRQIKAPVRRVDIFPNVKVQSQGIRELVQRNQDLLYVALGLCLR